MGSIGILIALVFIAGYGAIAFEHPLKINKAAPSLLTGVIICTLVALFVTDIHKTFDHHISSIASILFFLLGAMAVVELMDTHGAFSVITDRIHANSPTILLWIVGAMTFFLSSVLDNMTTAIVMSALLRKIIKDKSLLWTFAGTVIIAANAGGAWSPIGDVTTIMLWIGGQVTTLSIMKSTFIASLVCFIVPTVMIARTLPKSIERVSTLENEFGDSDLSKTERSIVFLLGLATLLGVPVFKSLTHLPPFMGVMLGLGILWVVTEIMHARHPKKDERQHMSVSAILQKIDHASILFFLGILFAVAGLEEWGHLASVATFLDQNVGNVYAINSIIGVLSAVVDNVPLVAASMGMYPLSVYPPDHIFWSLLALCAGTGGSILIIGSAAGVAVMGILGIDFGWYLKKIAFPAFVGYVFGIATFWLQHQAF
ncbi:MAG: hypothetical protein QG551_65 [Patescibacteria group bacterium]|nr:hypothetical protein [Patescibacteria group bacterium]